MRVLLILEDPDTRRQIETVLRSRDHEIQSETGGRIGWKALRSSPPALIIHQVRAGDEKNLKRLRRLRETTANGYSPVLVLTDSAEPDHLTRLLEAGADDYLLTPFDSQGLTTRLLLLERRPDRKRVQEALQESEARYRDLVEHTRALICIHDLEGTIRYINREAETITGFKRDGLIGKCLRELQPTDFFDRYMTEIRNNGFARGLMRIATASGKGRILEYRSTLRDDGVEAPVVRSLSIDITEQRRAERALRESEERYRTLFEGVPVGLYRSTPDGRFLDANPAMAEILGYPDRESLLATNAQDFYLDPEDRVRMKARLAGEGTVRDLELKLQRYDGTMLWARLATRAVRNSNGRILFYEGTVVDITENKQAEHALRESEERFRALVQNSTDMLAILDAEGTILYESPAVERVLGYAPRERTGTNKLEQIHPDDLVRVAETFRDLIRNPGKTATVELRLRHSDGTWRAVEATGANLLPLPAVAGLVVNSRDITERKQAEDRLIHDALHDALTGLPNRTLLLDRLERLTRASRREPHRPYAVLFLDLDRFKLINDSLGHGVGDLLLIEISKALEQVLRPTDTIARLGGDEFVVLLEDVQSPSDALRVAERIHYRLQTPFSVRQHEIFTTASIGIALSRPNRDGKPENLLRDADTAMYRAKSQGKACHVVFDDAMHQLAIKRLELETELRHALEQEDFRLLYQPITCLKSGELIGFESLVRWRHAERGLIPPGEFLSTMEETGLIIPLGRFILTEACRQARLWQTECPSRTPPVISVNLSNKQFFHPGLIDELQDIMAETGVDPTSLALEITEGVLVEHTDWAARRFSKLKEMRIQLYLDDFGKGYSSLSYLHGFPVDLLKIDRSFVDHLDQNGEHEEIVHAIVTLGHNLGLQVLAEGVETAWQAEASKKLACDYGQGFFFSKPVEAEEAVRLVTGGLSVSLA